MRASRRALLKSAGLTGVAATIPFDVMAKTPTLGIYDSRLPEARLFAAKMPHVPMIDLATADEIVWKTLRQRLATPGEVAGLTGWADWVTLRGLMEDHGKRMTHETRITRRSALTPTPFEWGMA
jgi:hypothetical protein